MDEKEKNIENVQQAHPRCLHRFSRQTKKRWNSLYLEDPLPFVAGSFNIKRINFDFSKGVFWECIETTFLRQ